MGFFSGSKGKFKKVSTLSPEQEALQRNWEMASSGAGAGGAAGTAADYYRDLMSDDSKTYAAMQAPEMRRFNEEIIPGLSEQFAGMGSGAMSSSGFQNAAVNAGTDLSERLGAIRAQLRQQGAQGLMGVQQQAMTPYNENVYMQGQQGFGQSIMPAIGTGVGAFFGGPLGAAVGGSLGGMASNWISNKGQTSPYGNNQSGGQASPYGGGYSRVPNR